MTRPLALLVVALSAPAVAAQEPPRFDVLRGLLRYHGVEPLADLPDRNDPCDDLVLVVVGRRPDDPRVIDISHRCMNRGGALLIASDGPDELASYVPPVQGRQGVVRAGGGPVICSLPDRCLGGILLQPFLTAPPVPPVNVNSVPLLAAGQLPRVATSFTAVLQTVPEQTGVFPLLVLPPGSVDSNLRPAAGRPVVALYHPGRNAGQRGTAVLAANTRLFGDALAAATNPDGQLDTDNFPFTFLVTKYLVDGGPKKRTRCLFLENGRIVSDFDAVRFAALPPISPPIPPLDQLQQKLVDEANRAMGEWQDKDGPSRAALGENAERLPYILRVLAVAAVVVLGVLLVKGWRAARLPTDLPRRPPPPPGRFDPPADQQADERVRADNLTEPARAHLRAVFAGWGAAGDQLPPVEFTGPRRAGIERDLAELWRVAAGRDDRPVTAARWKELRDMVLSVSRAADAGRWRFAPAGGAA